MSTFNGEKYLLDQIVSIKNQLTEHDHLIIRDDGSTDNTTSILRAINDSNIEVIFGDNLGFAKSFLWLIYYVGTNYDIYMLSDQDDIWMNHKISRARERLKQTPHPHLYCSRLQLVSQDLKPLGLSPKINRAPSFENAVCENIVTGCTIALNKSAVTLIREISINDLFQEKIAYHDWWIYLNLSKFGSVEWDETPTIFYRQHQNNVIGMGSGLSRYLIILKFVLRNSWIEIMTTQLQAFLKLRENKLSPAEKQWLESISAPTRGNMFLNILKDNKLKRQSKLGLSLFKILVAFEYARKMFTSNQK